ncbi:MAG: FMN-binding protein [Spirochaetota bacterium]|nr:FMN-binding protein [Spirochaetota bacterium]
MQINNRIINYIWITMVLFSISGCKITPVIGRKVDTRSLVDGIYQGYYKKWPNNSLVKVTIKNSRIEKVEVVDYFASWIGKKAVDLIPKRIVEKQSTDVDAVTGATNSSRVIMNAVQKAVEKAYSIDKN